MTKRNRAEFLARRLDDFPVEVSMQVRYLALFSAVISLGHRELLEASIRKGLKLAISRDCFYEVILQSYLFLGFPRMLTAAESLNAVAPQRTDGGPGLERPVLDCDNWYRRGLTLCKKVYGDSYIPLKERVQSMAPDIFYWMILEGYGKVLSRPELGIVEREACIVACLIMEDRPAQLRSHMMGTINVGGGKELLGLLIEDLGDAAGEGRTSALEILNKL